MINENTVTDTEWLDQVPYPDDYEYFVTSVYEYGESLPSGSVNIAIEDLLLYGDTDANWEVEAYDGALILQYVVGYDPLPNIDPLPWEEWRIIQSDTDGNGDLGAYDAALILQYTVGIINIFPCETGTRFEAPEAEIDIRFADGNLIFSATGKLYGFSLETRFTSLDDKPAIENGIYAVKNDGDLYSLALAAAGNLADESNFLSIPIQQIPQQSIQFDMRLNNTLISTELAPDFFLNNDTPAVTALTGNYPNPFNPATTIAYSLAEEGNVRLDIINIKGQTITQLVNSHQMAGNYEIYWNGLTDSSKQAASGVYFYRLAVDNKVFTKKMILLK